ncbi:MAG: DUF4912 domain-containing protein [Bacillota bacterium]
MESREYNLPAGYKENSLVLLVQNPTVLFAYWEISDAAWALFADRKMSLRLYSLADGNYSACGTASPSFSIGTWYFRGITPGERYRCELGWWENGEFFPLLCSDVVEVPPDKVLSPTKVRRRAETGGAVFVEAVKVIEIDGVSSEIPYRH